MKIRVFLMFVPEIKGVFFIIYLFLPTHNNTRPKEKKKKPFPNMSQHLVRSPPLSLFGRPVVTSKPDQIEEKPIEPQLNIDERSEDESMDVDLNDEESFEEEEEEEKIGTEKEEKQPQREYTEEEYQELRRKIGAAYNKLSPFEQILYYNDIKAVRYDNPWFRWGYNK